MVTCAPRKRKFTTVDRSCEIPRLHDAGIVRWRRLVGPHRRRCRSRTLRCSRLRRGTISAKRSVSRSQVCAWGRCITGYRRWAGRGCWSIRSSRYHWWGHARPSRVHRRCIGDLLHCISAGDATCLLLREYPPTPSSVKVCLHLLPKLCLLRLLLFTQKYTLQRAKKAASSAACLGVRSSNRATR